MATTIPPVGEWTFFAIRVNGTVLDIWTGATQETLATTCVLATGDAAFNVGDYGGGPMDGSLDEIGVWNRALSDEEVAQLYNGGNGLAYPFA